MAKIKISHKFAWDTDDLSAYVEQNIDDLVGRLIEGSKTARMLKTMEGLKGTQELDDIEVNFDWQAGTGCELTAGGTSTFGKKNITVADIAVLMKFCNKDLVGFIPQQKLAPGAQAELETLPFEAILMEQIIAKNNLKVDTAIWKSDTNSGDVNLNRFDGLLKQLDEDTGITDLTVSGGQITNSNAIQAFFDFDGQLPNALITNPAFAYITDQGTFNDLRYNLFTQLKDSPQYLIRSLEEGSQDDVIGIRHPITNRPIYWVPGLASTGAVVAGLFGANGQVYLGTDLRSDFEKIETWYEMKDDAIYVRLRFRLGTTYRLSENMGYFEATAS